MQIIPYMIAQMLGAFFSSAVVYGVYHGESFLHVHVHVYLTEISL